MGYRRFTIKPAVVSPAPGAPRQAGYAVYDRTPRRPDIEGPLRITVAFPKYEEALEHRDRINKLYLRFGW